MRKTTRSMTLVAALFSLFTVLAAGCDSEDSPLVGTWHKQGSETYVVFRSNGEFIWHAITVSSSGYSSQSCTYTYDKYGNATKHCSGTSSPPTVHETIIEGTWLYDGEWIEMQEDDGDVNEFIVEFLEYNGKECIRFLDFYGDTNAAKFCKE
jgi:hypothetical protein